MCVSGHEHRSLSLHHEPEHTQRESESSSAPRKPPKSPKRKKRRKRKSPFEWLPSPFYSEAREKGTTLTFNKGRYSERNIGQQSRPLRDHVLKALCHTCVCTSITHVYVLPSHMCMYSITYVYVLPSHETLCTPYTLPFSLFFLRMCLTNCPFCVHTLHIPILRLPREFLFVAEHLHD